MEYLIKFVNDFSLNGSTLLIVVQSQPAAL